MVRVFVNKWHLSVNRHFLYLIGKQYQAMDYDKSSADSEEEILVFAEFEDTVNIENYRSIHVLGIGSKNPIIQLDDTIFTGKLEYPLGTYMFFGKDPAPHSEDPLFDKLPKESLKFICKAKKYLKMNHTYISPRNGTEIDAQPGGQQHLPEENLVPLTFKTVQEAVDAFKSEWQSKMEETEDKTRDNPSSDHEMMDISYNS